MMKFEEYIRKNRPMMDVDQPEEEMIWAGISRTLEKHARQKRTLYWRYALLAAAMIVIAFAAGYHATKKNEPQLIFVNVDPELARQESEFVHFASDYTLQMEQENFNLETLHITPTELKYTDRLIEAYSADLRQHGPNPELIKTLLDLYEMKIMLLKSLLKEIEKK